MIISKYKLDIILARQCKSMTSLRDGVSPQTLAKINQGKDVKPTVVGFIAQALNVDVEEIIQPEKEV